jgi:hypothetical protein
MAKLILKLAEQPYWIATLFLGVVLVAIPCVTIDKDHYFVTHAPNTYFLVAVGIALLILSSSAFGFTLLHKDLSVVGAGINLTHVKESDGALSTTVGDCEIRVINGQIENQALLGGSVIALPCNEYFDDECAGDSRSALGAYVTRVFEGQAEAFVSLAGEECRRKLGPGVEQQKTDELRANSFGAGRCVLLAKPLGRSTPVALVSTTTQRAGEGLAGRVSYLFDGMRELVSRLADARLNEVTMPVMGAGHGRINPPLALVGLLLALAEAARYAPGGHFLKRVTIVVFKRDANSPVQVDPVVVRRTLALIGP